MIIEDLRRSWPRRDARHPFRTRKLRPGTAMVLHPRGCGRVAHRRTTRYEGPRKATASRGPSHTRNNTNPNNKNTTPTVSGLPSFTHTLSTGTPTPARTPLISAHLTRNSRQQETQQPPGLHLSTPQTCGNRDHPKRIPARPNNDVGPTTRTSQTGLSASIAVLDDAERRMHHASYCKICSRNDRLSEGYAAATVLNRLCNA